ncbi:hypothetical protein E2C01_077383 [Portunus trituberculatus]|uniref:Uncharacterized protein n=1 Tax=Portunus trituberculatus TaxID=210409 RepID=A0A5B7IFX9_PORTR|nr:hypothetical protein [Portunus trituberculatus]
MQQTGLTLQKAVAHVCCQAEYETRNIVKKMMVVVDEGRNEADRDGEGRGGERFSAHQGNAAVQHKACKWPVTVVWGET